MSVPYLNRGESLVLTTHRVSTGSVLYDAMLTNQRLILMDSRFDRFDPIPFPDIVTVKGGRASTGEPAIILTLKEPNTFSDSAQVSLIFTQNQGEKRRHERELWVKRLIELVISAREQEAQSRVVPVARKNGLQPSVRRWEAPEPVRPLSSAPEPAPPAAEPIVITEQEPDSLEFFLEEKNGPGKAGGPEADKNDDNYDPTRIVTAEVPTAESNPVVEKAGEDETPGQELPPEREILPAAIAVPRDPFAGIHIPPPLTEPKETPEPSRSHKGFLEEYRSQEPFDTIVRAAARSLQEPQETPAPPQPQMLPAKEPVVRKTTPIPDRAPNVSSSLPPAKQTPGEKRELPGTYIPEVVIPAIPPPSKKRTPSSGKKAKKAGKPAAPARRSPAGAAVIAVIAVIGILAIAAFALNSFYSSPYSNTVITITPSAGSSTEIKETPADLQPPGVIVRIIYPNDFAGLIGNPGILRQVSGTGNQNFSVLMTANIVQATIRKLDPSPESLTVEIYNNNTLLASRTVSSPQGEVSLLVDTTTAAAPGMSTVGIPASERPLLGNGSLIYY